MLYSTAAQTSFVALIAVVLFVLWAGQGWARLSAGVHFFNWVLVAAFQRHHEAQLVFQTPDFIVDLIGLAVVVAIAMTSRRMWAAGIAACQLLGIVNYIVVLLDRNILHRAFWTAAYLWEAGDLICLIIAGIEGRRAARSARRTVARSPHTRA